MLKWLNRKTLVTASIFLIPLIARAQDIDLSGFQETGDDVLSQLRESTLVKMAVGIISAIVGYIALFTKRLDWYWVGISIAGVFFIFGGDNIADAVIGFFK